MGLFDRFRESTPTPSRLSAAVILESASVERHLAEQTPYARLEEYRVIMKQAHSAFLLKQYEQGLRDDALAEAAATAMNTGAIPSLVPEPAMRGGQRFERLAFFTGLIPGSVLRPVVYAGSDRPGDDFHGSLTLDLHTYLDHQTHHTDSYSIDFSPPLPLDRYDTAHPIDPAVLDTIGQHIAGSVPLN